MPSLPPSPYASSVGCSLLKLFASGDVNQQDHIQDPFLLFAEMERHRKFRFDRYTKKLHEQQKDKDSPKGRTDSKNHLPLPE